MSDRRSTSPVLPIAVTVAVLLLAGYVGAYYWVVTQEMFGMLLDDGAPFVVHPRYRISGEDRPSLRAFFSPIHWLDRRIRPHVWEPNE